MPALPRARGRWGVINAKEYAREARDELGRAGAELARARAALGYGLRHVGTAARVGWLALVNRGIRVHPEVLIRRLALVLLKCGCDARDPRRCTGGFDLQDLGQQHGWCLCSACHADEGGAQ
jgi:hypothetical protein